MSVGFLKPIILNELFAHKHGFSKENAILYNNDDLEQAVIRALSLTGKDYKKMCRSLLKKKQTQEKESLENLRRLMHI